MKEVEELIKSVNFYFIVIEAEQAEQAALAAQTQAEMEKAGLVVLSEESNSPILLGDNDLDKSEEDLREIKRNSSDRTESSGDSETSSTESGKLKKQIKKNLSCSNSISAH